MSVLAPRFQPMSQPWTRQPASASALRSAIVVRSVAMKPGMTSAGGPSSGPRGPRWPKPCQKRGEQPGEFVQPPPAGRRPVVAFPKFRGILAPHQLLQRLGQPHPPVLGLVVLEQRHEDPRARQRGVVERVGEAHLAVGAAVAEVGPPRLPVVQRRAAVGLAIFAQARHPALDDRSCEICRAPCRRSRSRPPDRGFRAPGSRLSASSSSFACHSADMASSASQITYCSTLTNWWTRSSPRTSLPALPASRRKQGE